MPTIMGVQPHKFEYQIGYWWSEKKSQRLNIAELEALFAERRCQLVKIDLEKSLEDQGPFSLIVHKISDILVKANQGDQVAKKQISAFESYARKHPDTIILDPLDNNRILLDRYKQYQLIEQIDQTIVYTPPFVHLTSTNIDVNRGRIRRSKITFPIVCKPTLAQGSQVAHQMSIIFNEQGLKDVKPPCVAQSFVNHNAKLFKLFVIRDKYYVIERPSLKNFQAGDQETVFFYSHDISKPNSSSSLTELDATDPQAHKPPILPSDQKLIEIVKLFSEKLGLTFYGIDIIIDNLTSKYTIIDMNTFPGYDGVDNFLAVFRDVVCDAIPKEQLDMCSSAPCKTSKKKTAEFDSGIEST